MTRRSTPAAGPVQGIQPAGSPSSPSRGRYWLPGLDRIGRACQAVKGCVGPARTTITHCQVRPAPAVCQQDPPQRPSLPAMSSMTMIRLVPSMKQGTKPTLPARAACPPTKTNESLPGRAGRGSSRALAWRPSRVPNPKAARARPLRIFYFIFNTFLNYF